MRLIFSLALFAGAVGFAWCQPPGGEVPKDTDPRFGFPVRLKAFPQDTAKRALASTVEAIERSDLPYLVAHLMDPGFVDLRLGDRAKQFEAPAEQELSRQRDAQIRNPEKYKPEERLPTDRVKFAALIVAKSRELAFKQLVRDVEDKLLNDPQSIKDMKKILKDGKFEDVETGAKATHPDVKDRAVYFRKIGERWFLENRQEEQPKKDP